MTVYKEKGFTLIESIVAIVVLGISMTVLTTVLYPQIENSASSHYQVRASALAQGMMTDILSRSFDHVGDINGGIWRCDETGYSTCSVVLGAETGEEPKDFNDVDDYIGCWYTNDVSRSSCDSLPERSLKDILGQDISAKYPNFRVEVKVEHDNQGSLTPAPQPAGKKIFKLITLTVYPGKYGEYRFVAHRGNY
ncbi:prepilin-type N-terminal cleavage/methylation domain-containing protein [Vibrio tapetis subsp. quintayensis]|uniref:prepilin-type N-terminal cleavage/methylation domain-containing protein n=1 Tax=Vibrio tapetis TaxID=52443 RepID=UPI0025B47202|nr:prepilin-type N-terminal cleavage/methylation domain-containing protein [Vibrio tapetis]MDN3680409.1 prepilin-type N-terminal cleavage/methylation domain-containing protein [Vibrio tapetis subsp. quintayensis]